MQINKDTKLFCSFSENPGNFGSRVHNEWFQENSINAIYKSFRVTDIQEALIAMKILSIKGAGVSAPFKCDLLNCKGVVLTPEVQEIGSANTVLQQADSLLLYNTDYIAIHQVLPTNAPIFILGNGGYSKAAQYVCKKKNVDFKLITRDNWTELSSIRDSIIFNATPLKDIEVHDSNIFIANDPTTETGSKLALLQAREQFYLYTGVYPCL